MLMPAVVHHVCRYTPDASGYFAGQTGYGYISIARFIEAAKAINSGSKSIADITTHGELAVLDTTANVTAILEAGRISLDNGGAAVHIEFDSNGLPCALKLGA
jgi:D-galacturonate reductase